MILAVLAGDRGQRSDQAPPHIDCRRLLFVGTRPSSQGAQVLSLRGWDKRPEMLVPGAGSLFQGQALTRSDSRPRKGDMAYVKDGDKDQNRRLDSGI